MWREEDREPLASEIELMAGARGRKFGTILADPPWQFQNRTGKVAPEHKRLNLRRGLGARRVSTTPA